MKKILIITYYWPPSGGGGVQRWLKFVKYLPSFNIDPVVVIPKNPEYPVIDYTLKNDVPENTPIIEIPIWEPYNLFKLFTGKNKKEKVNTGLLSKGEKKSFAEKISLRIRGNLLIPDPRVFWVSPAKKTLKRFLKNSSIDTIITTGPPHSVHLIGLKLKKRLNIKWIADFRDPWSEIDYLEEFKPSKMAKYLQRYLERKVLIQADKVITVSHNWASDLKRLGAHSVSIITNGYDSDDFLNFDYNTPSQDFYIMYSGIIHNYRNPEYLWDTLEKLCASIPSFAKTFQLRLFGIIDAEVLKYIKKLPILSKHFYFGGYIPHDKLLKEYEKATALLHLQNNTINAPGHIPGKLFEYLATKKAIIGIGPVEGDSSRIINECNSGKVFERTEKDEIYNYIKDLYEKWQKDKLAHLSSSKYEQYSRENLTCRLVKEINLLKDVK